jgi:DNA-directed RNA polymerase subunit RPC12/RpoP
MSLRCQNCGAFYKGSISPYQKFVKCQHCGSMIKAVDDTAAGEVRAVLVTETAAKPSKVFTLDEFAAFLAKRGIKTFDPVSGILRLGSQQATVSQEGAVEGPEPLKLRVERWVQTYMSSG